MSKHTKGPIEVSAWLDSNGWPVYQIEAEHETAATMEANRKLFAAAPDLLEACKALVVAFDGEVDCTDILDMIGNKDSALRTAIARAEGRA